MYLFLEEQTFRQILLSVSVVLPGSGTAHSTAHQSLGLEEQLAEGCGPGMSELR